MPCDVEAKIICSDTIGHAPVDKVIVAYFDTKKNCRTGMVTLNDTINNKIQKRNDNDKEHQSRNTQQKNRDINDELNRSRKSKLKFF